MKTGGAAKEIGKLEQHFEPLFGVEVKQYSNKVDFVQVVTVRPGVKTSFAGTVEYMSCNDTECMPPARQRFSVALRERMLKTLLVIHRRKFFFSCIIIGGCFYNPPFIKAYAMAVKYHLSFFSKLSVFIKRVDKS